MHDSAFRREDGRLLRQAIDQSGLSLTKLAEATRLADEHGKGVNFRSIASLATPFDWARESTTPRSAELIERALKVEPGTLFEVRTVYARTDKQPAWDAL